MSDTHLFNISLAASTILLTIAGETLTEYLSSSSWNTIYNSFTFITMTISLTVYCHISLTISMTVYCHISLTISLAVYCHISLTISLTVYCHISLTISLHSKIENSYLEKNSCKILILSNILLKIRKTRENILIKN